MRLIFMKRFNRSQQVWYKKIRIITAILFPKGKGLFMT